MNCVDYYPGGDKPYLISGADDKMVRIWDYQTKACVTDAGEGHSNNVCSVVFHPRLPIIVSASEDGTVRIWHSDDLPRGDDAELRHGARLVAGLHGEQQGRRSATTRARW